MFDEDWKRLSHLTNPKEGKPVIKDPATSPAPDTGLPDTGLNEEELGQISGGLNPQPIPPGRTATFAGESGTGKTNIT